METTIENSGPLPDGDSMLVQKLMIETREDIFRSYANITIHHGGNVTARQYGRTGRLDNAAMEARGALLQ